MASFTKGKREVTPIYGNHWTVSAEGHVIIDCFSNKANARLIAAAPEMYELLRRCALFQPVSSNEIWAILDRIDGKEEA